MAQFDIYVDTYSGESVGGLTNPVLAPLPKFIQGDTISLRIYLLARAPGYPTTSTPYAYVNNAALSLKVALGPKNGTAGSTLYTQQFTWAKDGLNQYFFADLPLNTAAITTQIGTGESAPAWFEIEYTQGGFPTTVLQKQITIQAEVIETGSITVPAGLTALSAEEAYAAFLGKSNTGFILVCPDDANVRAYVYLGTDGALHVDPIT